MDIPKSVTKLVNRASNWRNSYPTREEHRLIANALLIDVYQMMDVVESVDSAIKIPDEVTDPLFEVMDLKVAMAHVHATLSIGGVQ